MGLKVRVRFSSFAEYIRLLVKDIMFVNFCFSRKRYLIFLFLHSKMLFLGSMKNQANIFFFRENYLHYTRKRESAKK